MYEIKQPQKNKRKKWMIVTGIILAMIVLVDQSIIGGTTLFYRTWISCGQKPVLAQPPGYMNVGVAHYVDPPDINIFPGAQKYFCTPIEAERESFSASDKEYTYPHLKAAGERIPRDNGSWEYPDGSILWPSGRITHPDGTTSQN